MAQENPLLQYSIAASIDWMFAHDAPSAAAASANSDWGRRSMVTLALTVLTSSQVRLHAFC
jgi:hypothetical protein